MFLDQFGRYSGLNHREFFPSCGAHAAAAKWNKNGWGGKSQMKERIDNWRIDGPGMREGKIPQRGRRGRRGGLPEGRNHGTRGIHGRADEA
jgi:hypothetical protein